MDYNNTYEGYIKAVSDNYSISSKNMKEEVELFKDLDEELYSISEHLNHRTDLVDDANIQYTFILLPIIHRQFRSGFELLRRRLSSDALAVIRIAIEATGHFYRIMENPDLLEVYTNREENKKKFEREFSGSLPIDIPNYKQLKYTRDMINQYDAHADSHNIVKSLHMKQDDNRTEIQVYYSDHLNDIFKFRVIHFLDCYWHCIDTVRAILEKRDLLPLSMTSSYCSWRSTTTKYTNYMNSSREWAKQFLLEE